MKSWLKWLGVLLLIGIVICGRLAYAVFWPPSYSEQRWELTWDKADETFPCDSRGLVTSLAVAPNGDIWGGAECGLVHFDGQSWQHYFTEQIRHIVSVTVTPDGQVWAGSSYGLFRLDEDKWTTIKTFQYLEDFAIATNGDIWVATSSGGLFHFDGKMWRQAYAFSSDGQNGCLSTVAVDPDGIVWAGSCYNDFRIDRFNGQDVLHYWPGKGIAGGFAYDIAIGADGDIWVGAVGNKGTGAGFAYFDGGPWRMYTEPFGMMDNNITSIVVERDGTAWLTTMEGLCRFDGLQCITYLPDKMTYAVVLDSNDDVWVGLDNAVAKLSRE